MNVPLWVYWEGPLPDWIKVCLRSMQANCTGCTFLLVTPSSISCYIPERMLPKNFWQLEYASQRSEWLRAALLTRHGGIYFDADTVGLNSPTGPCSPVKIALQYGKADFVFSYWNKMPLRVCTAYVYARKDSPIAAAWLEQATKIVESLGNPMPDGSKKWIGWTELSESIVTPMVTDLLPAKARDIVVLPLDTFLPVDIDTDQKMLLADRDPDEFIKPYSLCFGLNGSWLMNKDWGRPDLMLSDPNSWAKQPHLLLKLLSRYL